MKKETLRLCGHGVVILGLFLFQWFIWQPEIALADRYEIVSAILLIMLYIFYLRKKIDQYFMQDLVYIKKDLWQRSCHAGVTGIMFFIYFVVWRPASRIYFEEDIRIALPQIILVILFWGSYFLIEKVLRRYFETK